MKHKAGLQKKISSIFDGVPVVQQQGNADTKPGITLPDSGQGSQGVSQTSPRPERQATSSVSRTTVHRSKLSKAQERQKSKDRVMAIALCVLAILFVGVVYKLFFSEKAVNPIPVNSADKTEQTSNIATLAALQWSVPEPWPSDIRDPMALPEEPVVEIDIMDASEDVNVEPEPEPVVEKEPIPLKAIVLNPNGISTVLIGKEILTEGETYEDITIVQINQKSVDIKDSQGNLSTLYVNAKNGDEEK